MLLVTWYLLQTGWIQASRRVTRRLAWDPTCLLLSPSVPIKNKQNLKDLKSRRQYDLFLENYPACKGLKKCICTYAYANRLDPGQPPSNSAAWLRSNLFATQSLKVFRSRQQYNLFLENYPAFKGLFICCSPQLIAGIGICPTGHTARCWPAHVGAVSRAQLLRATESCPWHRYWFRHLHRSGSSSHRNRCGHLVLDACLLVMLACGEREIPDAEVAIDGRRARDRTGDNV